MEAVLGFVVGVVFILLCVRHAKKKPYGKTSRVLSAITNPGGGGGGPQEPG